MENVRNVVSHFVVLGGGEDSDRFRANKLYKVAPTLLILTRVDSGSY